VDETLPSPRALSSNHNSTKVCFAYFGFSPASDPRKKNAWFILYPQLRRAASRNCSIRSANFCA
jgi:hypothetical protein